MIVTVLLSAFSSQVILLLGRSPLGATSTNFGLFHFLGPVHNYCLRRGGGRGGEEKEVGVRGGCCSRTGRLIYVNVKEKKTKACLYFVEHFRIIMYYLWQCLDIQNHIIIINSHRSF